MKAKRVDALRHRLSRQGLDGVLIRVPEHVWWLSGDAPGHGAMLLVTMDRVLAVDRGHVIDVIHGAGLAGARLGCDDGTRSAGAVELADARAALADARRAKDADEIAALEHAARVVDEALAACRATAVAGATGTEVFAAASAALARAAGQAVQLEGNLGAGPAGDDPDAVPTDTPLREGEWLFVDLYPRVGGYYGDATRAFAIGRPTELAERLHRVLWSALDHAAEALRPGVAAGEIDARCRAVLEREGLEQHFPHHTGHGLGLQQQEPPMLVSGSPDPLRVGDVVTIEPGVYLPGVGGMRVEDVFVIETDGARRLTAAPRALSMEVEHG
ncbi:MAG TPA: Xaa-Pro peptidase family protein [Baekduia sp.]|nr:Xaa-Pro peptidase family protein [Baekduia sp.]